MKAADATSLFRKRLSIGLARPTPIAAPVEKPAKSSTMAPWSTDIMDCFQSISPDLESDFTPAAFNKLVNTLFPVNTPFTVFPQVHRHDDNRTPSARTTFTVYYKKTPVFLLDLHTYSLLPRVSVREAADNHIRLHIRDILPYCPLTTLHAVSAFGTRLCFYSVNPGGAISPNRPAETNLCVDDRAPVDWWDCDLLDDDGAIRLKEVVNKIRNQSENLDS